MCSPLYRGHTIDGMQRGERRRRQKQPRHKPAQRSTRRPRPAAAKKAASQGQAGRQSRRKPPRQSLPPRPSQARAEGRSRQGRRQAPNRSRSRSRPSSRRRRSRQDRRPRPPSRPPAKTRPRSPARTRPPAMPTAAAGYVRCRRAQDDRASAKQRGYVTYDELNKVLPSDKTSSEQIEDTMAMLNEMGINVIESEEAEEGAKAKRFPPSPKAARRSPPRRNRGEQYDRTDDPVRMYLREMGSVELLSREGEIAIAKRIEAGRELMIGALVRKPADLRGAHRVARRTERRQGSAARHHRPGSHVWRRSRRPGRASVPPPVGPDGKPLHPRRCRRRRPSLPPAPEFKKPRAAAATAAAAQAGSRRPKAKKRCRRSRRRRRCRRRRR